MTYLYSKTDLTYLLKLIVYAVEYRDFDYVVAATSFSYSLIQFNNDIKPVNQKCSLFEYAQQSCFDKECLLHDNEVIKN